MGTERERSWLDVELVEQTRARWGRGGLVCVAWQGGGVSRAGQGAATRMLQTAESAPRAEGKGSFGRPALGFAAALQVCVPAQPEDSLAVSAKGTELRLKAACETCLQEPSQGFLVPR